MGIERNRVLRLAAAALGVAAMGGVSAVALMQSGDDAGDAVGRADSVVSDRSEQASENEADAEEVVNGAVGAGDGAPEVREASIGEPVKVADFAVTVEAVSLEQRSEAEALVVVEVTLRNLSERALPYAFAAFTLEDHHRRRYPPRPDSHSDALGIGELDAGASIRGTVAFDAGSGSYTLEFDAHDLEHPGAARWDLSIPPVSSDRA